MWRRVLESLLNPAGLETVNRSVSGGGGLSQRARIDFVDPILVRWDRAPLPDGLLELEMPMGLRSRQSLIQPMMEVPGDFEPKGDFPSPALTGTLSPAGERMDWRRTRSDRRSDAQRSEFRFDGFGPAAPRASGLPAKPA